VLNHDLTLVHDSTQQSQQRILNPEETNG